MKRCIAVVLFAVIAFYCATVLKKNKDIFEIQPYEWSEDEYVDWFSDYYQIWEIEDSCMKLNDK